MFAKYRLEKFFIAIFIYSLFFSNSWTWGNVWHWLSALIVSISLLIIVYISDFSFKGRYIDFNEVVDNAVGINNPSKTRLSKEINLAILAFCFVAFLAVLEYFVQLIIFAKDPPISIGIPLSVYSFSAERALYGNILVDWILYHLTLRTLFLSNRLARDN